MICVYTANLDLWDNLRPPLVQPEDGVRYICFTNSPLQAAVSPWEFRPCPDLGNASRSSRVPKILPHLCLPEYDYSIWHDANFQLRVPARQVIGELLRFDDWCAHRHPARDCVYAEAEILLKEKIGTPALVQTQIDHYREIGYPAHHGLWANGFIVRRHTPKTARLNEKWWELFAAGCERDQLSFPVARLLSGTPLDGGGVNHGLTRDIFNSPYVKYNWHAAWRDREDNPSYQPQRDRLNAQTRRLAEVSGARLKVQEY